MNDNDMRPADYLKARLEQLLRLLDQQEMTLASAFLAQAIEAITTVRDNP